MGYGSYKETLLDRKLQGKAVNPVALENTCEFYAQTNGLNYRKFTIVHNTLGCDIVREEVQVIHITPYHTQLKESGGGVYVLACAKHGVRSSNFEQKASGERF